MKRILLTILAITLCLTIFSGCSNDKTKNNVVRPSKPSPSLNIVAELPSENTKPLTDSFDIRVGYGQAANWYNYATMEIYATDFEITDSQGNIYRDKYTYTISDFTNEKFFIADTTNFTDTCYYDTFTFKYIGEKPEASGGISVWLTTLQHGEPSTPAELNQGPEGVLVEFFYKIKNQQIILSTEKNKPPIIRRLPQGKATPYRVPPFNILQYCKLIKKLCKPLVFILILWYNE